MDISHYVFPPTFVFLFSSLEYQKVPHVGLILAKVLRVRQKENTMREAREKEGRERAQEKMGGGDGKRRKGEKVGQFVHVCAA